MACIRGGTVKYLGGPGDSAHDFCQGRILKVRQPGPVLFVGQKEVPEPLSSRFDL